MAQFLHVIKPLYEGDTFSMKVKRGDKEIEIPKVVLQGVQTAFDPGFLGILPVRDEPTEGLEIRYVYPGSPAAKVGLKEGDRIMKAGSGLAPQMTAFAGRDAFLTIMSQLTVSSDVKLEVKRKDGGKTETLTARLTTFPEDVPDKLPKDPSKKRALEKPKNPGPKGKPELKKDPPKPKDEPKGDEPKKDEPKAEQPKKDEPKNEEPKKDDSKKDEAKKDEPKKDEPKIEKGLLHRTNPALGRKYWLYVPRNYNPNVAHGVVIWLHAARREGRDAEDMVDIWDDYCAEYNLIMLGPISENKNGWVPSETEGILSDLNTVLGQYTIDRQRIVAHGAGIGGQMAFYLGFNARENIRGVATVGAVLASQPKDLAPNQRLQFYIAGGEKDPLGKDIKDSKPKLTERKYNVVLRVIPDKGKEYLSDSPLEFRELLRWIDSMDRN